MDEVPERPTRRRPAHARPAPSPGADHRVGRGVGDRRGDRRRARLRWWRLADGGAPPEAGRDDDPDDAAARLRSLRHRDDEGAGAAGLPAADDRGRLPVATLAAKTSYGLPTTLLLQGSTTTGRVPAGWLPVLVPLHKPNGTPGFVQVADVTETYTAYVIEVSLSQHMLTVKRAGVPIMSTKVIIGTPTTKTPTGVFSITDPLNCNTTSVPGYPLAKCSSVYGAVAIGTSGLSNDLSSFDGTIPQIALHGTDLPDTDLGQDLSNGCVRMPNAAIVAIAKLQPLLGTPVFITA